jgi:hypothetical protein
MCPWGDGARQKVFFREKVGWGKNIPLVVDVSLGKWG